MARSILVLAACAALLGVTACRADNFDGVANGGSNCHNCERGCIHLTHGVLCLPRLGLPACLKKRCTLCTASTCTPRCATQCTDKCADGACKEKCGLGHCLGWLTYRPKCAKCKCWRLAPCCRPPLYYFFLCEDCGCHAPYGGHCSKCGLGKDKGCCR